MAFAELYRIFHRAEEAPRTALTLDYIAQRLAAIESILKEQDLLRLQPVGKTVARLTNPLRPGEVETLIDTTGRGWLWFFYVIVPYEGLDLSIIVKANVYGYEVDLSGKLKWFRPSPFMIYDPQLDMYAFSLPGGAIPGIPFNGYLRIEIRNETTTYLPVYATAIAFKVPE